MVLDVFYLFGIVFILDELYHMVFKTAGFSSEVRDLVKKSTVVDYRDADKAIDTMKETIDFNKEQERKKPFEAILFYVNMAWVTLGLFTVDWFYFMMLPLISIVSVTIFIQMIKRDKKKTEKLLKIFFNSLSILVLSFIIYHHFFLHDHCCK